MINYLCTFHCKLLYFANSTSLPQQRYQNHLGAAMDVASKKGMVIGLANSSLWVVIYLMFAGIMWFGLWLIQKDEIEPGSILQVDLWIL